MHSRATTAGTLIALGIVYGDIGTSPLYTVRDIFAHRPVTEEVVLGTISAVLRLNFWPKVRVSYPTELLGQSYVSSLNWLLRAGCIGVVLYFRESGKMEAAFGLAVTITMLMTKLLLLAYYLRQQRTNPVLRWLIVGTYHMEHVVPEELVRIDFRLGFRIDQAINYMFRQVVTDLVKNKEIDTTSRYTFLRDQNIAGDFQYVLINKTLPYEYLLHGWKRVALRLHGWLQWLGVSS